MIEIILVVFLIIIFSIIIGKFLAFLFLLKPSLKHEDVSKSLKVEDFELLVCVELSKSERRNLNKKIKSKPEFFESLFLTQSFYKATIFFNKTKELKLYNVYVKQLLILPFTGVKNFEFFEESDPETLEILKKQYFNYSIIINNKCPACNEETKESDIICKGCGLQFL